MSKILVEDNTVYKELNRYKTFYRKHDFVYYGQDDKIKKIVKALNIKSRKERLEYIFDESCKEIDSLIQEENICDFNCNQCIAQRKYDSKEINGCCRMCRHQSSNGCTTINLACKLFFCSEIKNKKKVPKFNDLELLKLLSCRQRLILKYDLFSLREEILMDLYAGSLIVATSRQFIMLIKIAWYLLFKNRETNIRAKGRCTILSIIFAVLLSAMCVEPTIIMLIIVIGVCQGILAKYFIGGALYAK